MVHLVLASSVLIAMVGHKRSKYTYIVSCLLLFAFAALRYTYGNDYGNYYANYFRIHAGVKDVYDEWLFTLLNQISPSFFSLIAVSSAVFVYCIYRLIVDNLSADFAWIGLLIFVVNPYLFLMNLSALRQCIAMVAFIAAVHFAIERKPLPYVLLIGVAILFHKSALILLPVWLLCGQGRVNRRMVLSIVLALFFLLFVVDLDTIVLRMVNIFDDANYLHYATNGMQNSLRATLLTGISFLYVIGNLPRLEGRALVYSKLYLVGLMLAILAFRLSMLTRPQMYFDIFSVVSIPAILHTNQRRGPVMVDYRNKLATVWELLNRYILPILIFLIYGLRYYSFFTNPSWSAFSEYHTIFSLI